MILQKQAADIIDDIMSVGYACMCTCFPLFYQYYLDVVLDYLVCCISVNRICLHPSGNDTRIEIVVLIHPKPSKSIISSRNLEKIE